MRILESLTRHMDHFLRLAVWPEDSPAPGLWWSMVDLKTGGRPASDRAAGVAKRCYRWIESPDGSNLYWDGPLLVAAHALSARTGDEAYARSADRYITAYLSNATSASGLTWWGNHYYLDEQARPVWFTGHGRPLPVGEAHLDAPLHETRPLPVPWALLHKAAASTVAHALRAHDRHLAPAGGAGCFNRHADGKLEYAFLEAGGILALSLAHGQHLGAAAQAGPLAKAVLAFSVSKRDPSTGLLPVNATRERWDFHQATSEVGLWASAAWGVDDLIGTPELAKLAAQAVGDWAERAWCDQRQQFHGRLVVKTGLPDTGPMPTIYSPGTWCDPWNPLFPAHDYPWQMAEACLTAWQRTGEPRHALAVSRWAACLGRSLPARNGLGGYAEHYGRAIHFFWRAGRVLANAAWTQLAHETASEALHVLAFGQTGALRSHPWEDRLEAVDGMGWLILALLCLETGREQPMEGLFW